MDSNPPRPTSGAPNPRPALDPAERARRIREIRLSLTPILGGYVSQSRFGELVAEAAGLDDPINQSSTNRWEDETNPAEPGLVIGAAIATLGRRYAEWLVYADAPDVRIAPAAPPASLPTGFERGDDAQSPTAFFADQQHAAGRGLSRPRVAVCR